MNRIIPIKPFRTEGFAVKVRLGPTKRVQDKRQSSTQKADPCYVVATREFSGFQQFITADCGAGRLGPLDE